MAYNDPYGTSDRSAPQYIEGLSRKQQGLDQFNPNAGLSEEEMIRKLLMEMLNPKNKGRKQWSVGGKGGMSGFGPKDQVTPEMLQAMGILTGMGNQKFDQNMMGRQADLAEDELKMRGEQGTQEAGWRNATAKAEQMKALGYQLNSEIQILNRLLDAIPPDKAAIENQQKVIGEIRSAIQSVRSSGVGPGRDDDSTMGDPSNAGKPIGGYGSGNANQMFLESDRTDPNVTDDSGGYVNPLAELPEITSDEVLPQAPAKAEDSVPKLAELGDVQSIGGGEDMKSLFANIIKNPLFTQNPKAMKQVFEISSRDDLSEEDQMLMISRILRSLQEMQI